MGRIYPGAETHRGKGAWTEDFSRTRLPKLDAIFNLGEGNKPIPL